MNGASTNPDAHVFAYAAAQVKKGLDISLKLGAENFGRLYIILNTVLSWNLKNPFELERLGLPNTGRI